MFEIDTGSNLYMNTEAGRLQKPVRARPKRICHAGRLCCAVHLPAAILVGDGDTVNEGTTLHSRLPRNLVGCDQKTLIGT